VEFNVKKEAKVEDISGWAKVGAFTLVTWDVLAMMLD
jgi:hypothetical protein